MEQKLVDALQCEQMYHHDDRKENQQVSYRLDLPYNINNTPLKAVTEAVYIGVTITESLNWKTHIKKAASKTKGVL